MESLHQYIYQARHPWHWLTYGQNSTAIAALAAVVAALAAIVAGIYAVKTYQSTRSQLELLYRPVINIEYAARSNMIEFVNVGNVPALNVRWLYKGANYEHRPVFPPNETAVLTYTNDFEEKGAEVEYESLDGTKWVSRASRCKDSDDGRLHTKMTIRRR